MVKKQIIAPKNMQRFVLTILFIFLVQIVGTFIFLIRSDFLRFSSPGLLLITISQIALPAALFIIAFAVIRNTGLIRRAMQTIVWTFMGMTLHAIIVICWYVSDTTNYGSQLDLLVYGPGLVTIGLFSLALAYYRLKSRNDTKLFLPRWFENTFTFLALSYMIMSVTLVILDILRFEGMLQYSYILYSVVPILLSILLATIGYFSLNVIKDKSTRLYMSAMVVGSAIYVGTGLAQFSTIAHTTDPTSEFSVVGSFIVATSVFIIFIIRIRIRVLSKETL